MSDNYRIPFDEAIDCLKEECEATADAAAETAEDAAYWWSRIMHLRAELQGDTLLIEVAPEHVGKMLQNHFEEIVEGEVFGDPDLLAHYWRIVCPSKAEVLYDDCGDCTDVLVTEDDVAVDAAE